MAAPMPRPGPQRRRGPLLALVGVVVATTIGAIAVTRLMGSFPAPPAALLRSLVSVTSQQSGGRLQQASGIVLTAQGLVVTGYDGVVRAERIQVRGDGGATTYAASIAALDPDQGLAVLQIQGARPTPGPPAPLVGGAATPVEAVAALGSDASGRPRVSDGRITGLGETLTFVDPSAGVADTVSGAIQFDAPGGSADVGGALIDASGHVLGVIVATASQLRPAPAGPSAGSIALPLGAVTTLARHVESDVPGPGILLGDRAVLGVGTVDSPSPPGARVVSVASVSPAQAAGLVPGDVITEIGGVAVRSAANLDAALRRRHPGDRVEVGGLTAAGGSWAVLVTLSSGVAG
jgi:S1-C subfamily serine protease